jgi:FHA domain
MIDQNSRPARKVGIADHLWETFEEMAQQMGSDRDALINQALFMFARLNGFIEVGGKASRADTPAPLNVVPPAPVRPSSASPSVGKSGPPVLSAAPAPAKPAPIREESPSRQPPRPVDDRPSANALDNDPVRREVAERVLETAAELERLIKGKNEPPQPVDDDSVEDEEPPDVPEDSGLRDMQDEEPPPDDENMDEEPPADEEEGTALFLISETGDQQKVVNDRFVIGRGKHCDLVINSGKVSREHAVILREGSDYFVEDLGSSNGTWFNKQRIKRRKIEDGDEYFICSEKIRLVIR